MGICKIIMAALLSFVVLPVVADVGQIKQLTGQVHILRGGSMQTAVLGGLVEQHDTIVTGEDGSVGITFIDNTRFSAGPDSVIELARFRFDSTTHEGEFLTRVNRGTLAVISGQMAKQSPDAMKVETPTVILGVRGTEFLIKVED